MIELDAFTTALARQVVEKAGPELLAYLEARRVAPEADPLLTAKEAGDELGLSDTKIREMVESGVLHKCPGISEIRIRRSVVRAYGTKPSRK